MRPSAPQIRFSAFSRGYVFYHLAGDNKTRDGGHEVSHNSTGNTRTASLKKSGTEIASEVITSAGSGEPLHVMVADNLDSGIYVLDANDTMYVYKIVVTYTVDYGSGS